MSFLKGDSDVKLMGVAAVLATSLGVGPTPLVALPKGETGGGGKSGGSGGGESSGGGG